MEIADLFTLLESNQLEIVEDVKNKFHELFHSSNPNDSWLVSGLFDYSIQTGSLRTVEILVGVREPHDNHLFNKFSESLRSSNKLHGLTLLGHVVRRQPTWLFKITRHVLFKDLLRLLKTESDILPLISALLIINILLPMIAGLMEPYLQDLFYIFSHLSVWDTVNPNKLSDGHLLHLQMALYALFLRLYSMYPCNFLLYLRQEYSHPHKISIFNHTIKPMLDNVKIHPLLVTASKETEVTPARWRKMEPHDVVVECAKYAIGGEYDRVRDEASCQAPDFTRALENKYLSWSAVANDKDVWSPTSYCGMTTPPESAPTSIPHTPIAQTHIISTCFPQQEGTSPPEAAVEATPESTPIKDFRHNVRGPPPPNSSVARALNTLSSSPNHSQPPSPMKKEPSPFCFSSDTEVSAFHQPVVEKPDSLAMQKVQQIVVDRVQVSTENTESKLIKAHGLLQPTSPLRLISGPSWGCSSPAEMEDREVESMMITDSNSAVCSPKPCDSAVQDIDHDDLEECHQDCTVGGLCMPNSDSMRDFTRQVKSRLRYYSQCHVDNSYQGLSTGSSPNSAYNITAAKVRRTNSCPEMKKTCSSLERHPVEKVEEEEPSSFNGQAVNGESNETLCTSVGTQTDNPLPYEHLFLAVFPAIEQTNNAAPDTASGSPTQQVDYYLNIYNLPDMKKNKSQGVDAELRLYKDHLFLMGLQLHFEKHRREMHAERNRRLLGKCRKVRSQEELTCALKDQVCLLQRDKELLHNDLHKRADEAKAQMQQLQDTISYYQNQNISFKADYAKEKMLRESLEQQLRQERDSSANITKELQETKASLFNATNQLEHAANMAIEGRDLQESIQSLQQELLIGGEVQERYRQRVNSLLRHVQQSSEESLLLESSSHQICVLNQILETQTAALEALKSRVGELDAIILKRDNNVAEIKRLLQESKDKFYVQLEAVESKYNSLRAVNSRLEGELMELKHQVGLRQLMPQALPVPNSDPSLNLHAVVEHG